MMKSPIPKNRVGIAFACLIEKMGRADVEALMGDWNGSELSEDGTKISFTDTRSGTGKWTYSRSEFFTWLFSDEPLDPAKYVQDQEWIGRVKLAREAAQSA